MHTLKLSSQAHAQLRQCARQHGQSMKQIAEKVIRLLHDTSSTPEALAQQLHSSKLHQRLATLLTRSENKLQQRLHAQQALLTMLLEKLNAFNNSDGLAALQNTLERIETQIKELQ